MILRHLLTFLFVLAVPVFGYADMVGYNGDLRRYVTDSEKSQFPFNTVVRFDDGVSTGTGTFVSPSVILTCRHVVDSVGAGNAITYYTSDGVAHSGVVFAYIQDDYSGHDFAYVIDRDALRGKPVLDVASAARDDANVMTIGYDSLKPLSPQELAIIKDVYKTKISQAGGLRPDNAFKILAQVEKELRTTYACTTPDQQNCVHCTGEFPFCIFDDSKNMKTQSGCAARVSGNQIHTTCAGAQGASGSPVIDGTRTVLSGVLCEVEGFKIGQSTDATSWATRPEMYYDTLKMVIENVDSPQ